MFAGGVTVKKTFVFLLLICFNFSLHSAYRDGFGFADRSFVRREAENNRAKYINDLFTKIQTNEQDIRKLKAAKYLSKEDRDKSYDDIMKSRDELIKHLQGRLAGANVNDDQFTEISNLLIKEQASKNKFMKDRLDEEGAAESAQANLTSAEEQIKELRDEYTIAKKAKNRDTYGLVVARGLAGRDWEALEDTQIESIYDGFKHGLAMRATQAVGDVVSEKVKGTVENTLGKAWDFGLGKLIDAWNELGIILFHDSNQPFTVKEIEGWAKLIKACIEDIERVLKDGVKDSLRGHDTMLRQFDGDDAQQAQYNVWFSLISGYADQFDYFVKQIDARKLYYKEEEITVFYASQIQSRLLVIRDLLLASKSVKDLETMIDSNKAIIPAIKKNIENLFSRLVEQVEPRSYSIDRAAKSSPVRDTDRRSRLGLDNDNDDYSGSFMNR